ncbi:hypothetical protein [Kitasatospora sp. GAS204B]|uniref:hypothetical protein n=1 Tax=unclassified Kitasatospora TaxID=2633591 RepID=UPI002475BE6B|nr:hypothetical protein [Kitasatospora sp. GAS204B]MDH6121589.1 hypothetical protein [Kitasatospora sp. GAS204B]
MSNVIHGSILYTAAVKSGHIDLGSAKTSSPTTGVAWTTTQAFPAGAAPACGVTIADMGNHIFVEGSDTNGVIYGTTCDFATADNSTPVACPNAWTAITAQPNAPRRSGAPPFGVAVQHRPGPAQQTRSIKVIWEPYVRRTS